MMRLRHSSLSPSDVAQYQVIKQYAEIDPFNRGTLLARLFSLVPRSIRA
jgi:hypothetical protein